MTNQPLAAVGHAAAPHPAGQFSKLTPLVSMPPAPALPSNLDWALDHYATKGDVAFDRLSRETRQEAAALCRQMAALCASPSRDQIAAWVLRVAQSCAKVPPPYDVAMRVQTVLETSGDLCAGVWTRETRAAFSRTHSWFPGDAEIDTFLRPQAEALQRQYRGLQAAAKEPVPTKAPEPPSEEDLRLVEAERARVGEQLAELAKGFPSPNAAPARPVPAARPSREQLMAAYRQSGDGPAVQARLRGGAQSAEERSEVGEQSASILPSTSATSTDTGQRREVASTLAGESDSVAAWSDPRAGAAAHVASRSP